MAYFDGRTPFLAVRQILLKEWDPLGVGDVPAAEDEYDRIVPALVSMLERGRGTADLKDVLIAFEEELVGQDADTSACERAAQMLSLLSPRS